MLLVIIQYCIQNNMKFYNVLILYNWVHLYNQNRLFISPKFYTLTLLLMI